MFKNFVLIDHPLLSRDMTILRSADTEPELFRTALQRIARILAIEITKNIPLTEIEVQTPLEKTKGYKLAAQVVLSPVLRAGLGMMNSFLEFIPDAKIGLIGLKRDEETLHPDFYYYKGPSEMEKSLTIVLDPMLATGGSAAAAVYHLKERGAKNIIVASLVAAPEGIKKLNEDHPDVIIFSAALDRELNEKGYILPGLGDAGDRIFGT